jgi:hypothetical protein
LYIFSSAFGHQNRRTGLDPDPDSLECWIHSAGYRYVVEKRFFNFYFLSLTVPAAVGPFRQEIRRPMLRAEPEGQPARQLRLQPPQPVLRPLLRRRRSLRHAPLLTPQRTLRIRHGVRRHFVPLLHQFRRENHPLSDSACGFGLGGCGSGPVAGRLAVRRGQFVCEPEVHAGGEFNNWAAVLSGGL